MKRFTGNQALMMSATETRLLGLMLARGMASSEITGRKAYLNAYQKLRLRGLCEASNWGSWAVLTPAGRDIAESLRRLSRKGGA